MIGYLLLPSTNKRNVAMVFGCADWLTQLSFIHNQCLVKDDCQDNSRFSVSVFMFLFFTNANAR